MLREAPEEPEVKVEDKEEPVVVPEPKIEEVHQPAAIKEDLKPEPPKSKSIPKPKAQPTSDRPKIFPNHQVKKNSRRRKRFG